VNYQEKREGARAGSPLGGERGRSRLKRGLVNACPARAACITREPYQSGEAGNEKGGVRLHSALEGERWDRLKKKAVPSRLTRKKRCWIEKRGGNNPSFCQTAVHKTWGESDFGRLAHPRRGKKKQIREGNVPPSEENRGGC